MACGAVFLHGAFFLRGGPGDLTAAHLWTDFRFKATQEELANIDP